MPPKVARYEITPVGKPRMTHRDKWAQRPCVMAYWAFKDEVRRLGIAIPENGAHVEFYLPMPKSWTRAKTEDLAGMPHRQVPDIDNLLKALLDAVYDDDKGVWDIHPTKRWGVRGQIIVRTEG